MKGDNDSVETSRGSVANLQQKSNESVETSRGSVANQQQREGKRQQKNIGKLEALIDRRESPEVLRRQKPILRPTSSTEINSEEIEEEERLKVVYR